MKNINLTIIQKIIRSHYINNFKEKYKSNIFIKYIFFKLISLLILLNSSKYLFSYYINLFPKIYLLYLYIFNYIPYN